MVAPRGGREGELLLPDRNGKVIVSSTHHVRLRRANSPVRLKDRARSRAVNHLRDCRSYLRERIIRLPKLCYKALHDGEPILGANQCVRSEEGEHLVTGDHCGEERRRFKHRSKSWVEQSDILWHAMFVERPCLVTADRLLPLQRLHITRDIDRGARMIRDRLSKFPPCWAHGVK